MNVLTTRFCNVSDIVGVDMYESLLDDDHGIVSQWREVSADEKSQLRERFDEILRPLGYETSLVVMRRAN